MKIFLPEKVNIILNTLYKNGFEAYVVGGCVRDSLLGAVPNDWDICTNARPEEIKNCFKNFNTFDAGIKHGTISVVLGKEIFEVTAYRIDGEYSDNRHPESVTFTSDILKDLARRDFTVNSMAYNEKSGLKDPFGGRLDLENKIIKCVGNPDKRFSEDALRIIRALRFASAYGFSFENKTSKSICKNAALLKNISSERIASELDRLLCGKGVENILNNYRDVFAVIIPEIVPTFDFEQYTKHHNRDVWRHTTHAVASIDATALLRMTMLLHDLGKPNACKRDSDGTCHFKGHPKYSAEFAVTILHRLKYPTHFIEACLKLIIYHDVRFHGTKRQVKHIMNAIGEDNTELLFKVQRADILAQSDYMQKEKLGAVDLAEAMYKETLKEQSCFTLKQLAVNGNDLINIGITDGKQIGKILRYLLSMVIDEKIQNEKSALLKQAETEKEEQND